MLLSQHTQTHTHTLRLLLVHFQSSSVRVAMEGGFVRCHDNITSIRSPLTTMGDWNTICLADACRRTPLLWDSPALLLLLFQIKVNMFVCMCVALCVCMCVPVCVGLWPCVYVCVYVREFMCVHVRVRACVCHILPSSTALSTSLLTVVIACQCCHFFATGFYSTVSQSKSQVSVGFKLAASPSYTPSGLDKPRGGVVVGL